MTALDHPEAAVPRTVQLAIPSRARTVLERVADLPSDQRALLLAAFSSTPSPTTLAGLSSAVAAVLNHGDAERLIREIVGLTSLAATHSYALGDTADAVAASDDLKLDDEHRDELRHTLEELLTSPAASSIGKAVDLYREQPNVLHTVRIVSDIRPLIAADADRVEAAVVVHHLRLAYFGNGASTDLDIAIDRDDIEDLIAALQRAQAKDELLRTFLSDAGVATLEPSVD